MAIAEAGWEARLALTYALREGRSVLARREHDGPLVVQKSLYPEGDAVCHNIILHPPGGIAGGDSLALAAQLGEGSAVLLTTPGAGKWYKSMGATAHAGQRFDIGRGAALEWLPQPTIVFDQALAEAKTEIFLEQDALYIGWDITCMGRTASGERFNSGKLRQRTQVWQQGRRLWCEYARLDGDDPMLASMAGMAACSVSATLIAAGKDIDKDLLQQCRGIATDSEGQSGITALPRVLLARYLGASSEAAMQYFVALWSLLRPALAGRSAVPPRIWKT